MQKWVVGLSTLLLGLVVMSPSAKADIYTLNLSSNNCCGTGPFGTITVNQGINANTVDVVVTLATGNVFAKTGSGLKPVIGFLTNKSITFTSMSSGFAGYTTPAGSFPNFGTFQYTVVCNACGNGTSPPQYSTASFSVFNAGGLTPANFIQNTVTQGHNTLPGYYFAVDLGVPRSPGSSTFNTFDAASNSFVPNPPNPPNPTPVPEPSSVYLLMSAVGACVWGIRKRLHA